MTPIETMELTLVDDSLNAVQVFTGGGMNAILDKIEATVRAIELDPSTIAGRDQIRSVAYKVARTKTALDAEGKKLTEEWRKNTTLVNAERKKSTERLDALAEEVRKPLTEFENKERNRVAAHEECLAEMSGVLAMLQNSPDMDVALLQEHLLDFSELHRDHDWEEFSDRAARIRREVSITLIGKIESRKKHDADQAELARLRQEEAQRQQRERDEAIARASAEKAHIQAELKAKEAADSERRRVAEEADRVRREHEQAMEAAARVQREAEEAAERKRQEEERGRLAAEKRAKDAEDARIAAENKAEAERLAAEVRAAADLKAVKDKADREQAAALQRQRDRIERERKAAEDARLKREADEANVARIHAEIRADLLANWTEDQLDLIVADEIAVRLVDAIMAGNVRNLRVIY